MGSRGSPDGPNRNEFADPLDDYDSEIEYDDEHDGYGGSSSGDFDQYKRRIDFKNDYEPLKFGIKQEKMMIVLEYQLPSNQRRF
jgi:hypothetical protein